MFRMSEWEQVLNTDNYAGGSSVLCTVVVLYNIKLGTEGFCFMSFFF